MLGTLNGGLEARGVKLSREQIWADVLGVNEVRDGLPVLVRVHVHYHLSIPAGTRETVDRLLAKHADKCPTAASLKGAVEVIWDAEIRERARAEGPGPD
jgi:organic hydroperoxide reductase OsmC/OhrA